MSDRLRRWWWAGVERLDRPGRRALLVVPASAWMSVTQRTPCVVYWRDGVWIHRYRDAKIPHASLGRAARTEVFTAEARDVFLHAYTPKEGDVVVDVGAGVGAETLLFSRLVGRTGRVVALEAHRRTYARLADLCRVNALQNVVALQVAATDRDGEVTISDSQHHLRNTIVGDDGGPRVPARRLDGLVRELGLTRIDLLKMNVEGAERLALPGLEGVVERTQHVCISCHDFLADAGAPESMRTRDLVCEWLTRHGFEVSTRQEAPEAWLRDYVYGVRRN